MQLIPNWKDAWRMSSVNLPAIGLALLTIIEAAPDAILTAYIALPADVRALIDPEHVRYAGYALIAIGAVSRIVRQPKLAQDKADAAATR